MRTSPLKRAIRHTSSCILPLNPFLNRDMEITLIGNLRPAVREVCASKHPLINFRLLEDTFITSGMGDFLSFSGNRGSSLQGFVNLDEHAGTKSGYLQAARQWLILLKVDHPEVVELWRAVYTHPFFGPHTHTETFEVRREYEILARQNFLPRGKYSLPLRMIPLDCGKICDFRSQCYCYQ
jgi:hypothetical protein